MSNKNSKVEVNQAIYYLITFNPKEKKVRVCKTVKNEKEEKRKTKKDNVDKINSR